MPRTFASPSTSVGQYRDGLPTSQTVGLYYRQSSEGSIGNVYTSMQTVDMFQRLRDMGWQEERIRLIDIDQGRSGSLKIDERAGMSELYGLIINGEVGAVAAHAEDRFFRDETMIQPNVFIDACKRARVKVLTADFVYDFAHPRDGMFHVRQFRWKCEMGAEYINTQVIGKLAGARAFLMRLGRWTGAPMPVGYMADARAELRAKERNPDHRRFFPFEPYAEVVREYYRVFVELGGDLARTHHHIYNNGVFLPDPAICLPPAGFVVNYSNLRRRDRGYYPSRAGLGLLLTNPVYIGHWQFKNTIVQWNNHPPIVDESTFWQAFNYLSPANLDGSPNPNYRPIRHNSRPTVQAAREAPLPLCVGLLFYENGDQLQPIAYEWAEARQYKYVLRRYNERNTELDRPWTRRADLVDEAVSYHVIERLKSQFSDEGWQATVDLLKQDHSVDERARLQHQLQAVERDMERTKLRLRTYEDVDLIRDDEQTFQYQKAERARILAKLELQETQRITSEQLAYLREHYTELIENWYQFSREGKRGIVQRLVQRITLTDYAYRKPSCLKITWHGGGQDETNFIILSGLRGQWTYAEQRRILEMIHAGESLAMIQQAFKHHRSDATSRVVDLLLTTTSGRSSGTSFKSHCPQLTFDSLAFLLRTA